MIKITCRIPSAKARWRPADHSIFAGVAKAVAGVKTMDHLVFSQRYAPIFNLSLFKVRNIVAVYLLIDMLCLVLSPEHLR